MTIGVPANGALITGGQPTFKGSADDGPSDSGTVTVDVYPGTTTSAVPAEVLTTTVDSGGYSVPSTGLADGTYTVVASESDTSGDVGSSQPVTFSIFNGTPTLTLTAPAAPIRTAVPTFTGTGMLGPGDAASVNLVVYQGSSTQGMPMELQSAALDAAGNFSVQVTPGLANGTYTAVAEQELPTSFAYSPPVQFTVASVSPLTITTPTAKGFEPQTHASFSGTAGDDYGDADTIKLTLYKGARATGTPVGTEKVIRTGASWKARWPTKLALGTYTLVAGQMNLVNESRVTRTFTVATTGTVTGAVTISAGGLVTARIACLAGAGTCEGDVLILTARDFQPVYGGPSGPLHLLFAHYRVAGGKSQQLTALLSDPALAALKRARATRLVVTVASSDGTKLVESSHTTAPVKVG